MKRQQTLTVTAGKLPVYSNKCALIDALRRKIANIGQKIRASLLPAVVGAYAFEQAVCNSTRMREENDAANGAGGRKHHFYF
jgi:hypothetical protein